MRWLIVPFLLTAGLLTLAGCRHKADLPPSVDDPTFGHRHVFAGMPCSLSVTASDPDSDEIAVRFSWGDGDTSDWSAYVATGSRVAMAHTWQRGTYDVRVQAEDRQSRASSWFWTHHMTVRDPYPDSLISTLVVEYYNAGAQLPFSPDGQFLYVPDYCGLDVIRTSDNTMVTRVPLCNVRGVSVSPDGSQLYVICTDDSVLRCIRSGDWTVNDSIVMPGAEYPFQVAAHPAARGRAYVTSYCEDAQGREYCRLYEIDLAVHTAAACLEIPNWEFELLITPDGGTLFLGGDQDLLVVRTSDNTVIDTLAFGGSGLVLSSDGRRIYRGGGPIRVIDVARRIVVDTLSCPSDVGFAVLPGDQYVYVPDLPNALVYSISERRFVDSLPGVDGHGGYCIARQDGKRVFVAFGCFCGIGVSAYTIAGAD